MFDATTDTDARCYSVSLEKSHAGRRNKSMLSAEGKISTMPPARIFLLRHHRPTNFSGPKIFQKWRPHEKA